LGDACIGEKVDHRIGESFGERTQQPRSLRKRLFLAATGTSSAGQGNLCINEVAAESKSESEMRQSETGAVERGMAVHTFEANPTRTHAAL